MAEYKGPLDYIDVAARIVEFRTKHPEGSLQCIDLKFIDFANKSWVVYTAAAYRTPDDQRPGIGTAWEPVPGPTQFTRDSEVQNAETAAWGRAMVAALAVDTKKGIASQEEVRNRQVEATEKALKADKPPVKRAPPNTPHSEAVLTPTQQQIKDGLEMLSPDERTEFGSWWVDKGYTKGVQNLSDSAAQAVWGELFARLNATEPSQGNLDPSEAILDAFPQATEEPRGIAPKKPRLLVEATPDPNVPTQKQMDTIRKICNTMGVDTYDKCTTILGETVESLRELTKAQASKIVGQLMDEQGPKK